MSREMTLSQAVIGTGSTARKAMLVLAGSAFIAVAAQISVPMLPVPMTLQTLAILMVGFVYGARLGALTLVAYLAEGAMGLPVFANGMNGLAFAGPTAGFLLGFVAMAWAAGFAAERGLARGVVGTALSALLISAALYVPGVAWPALMAGGFGFEAGWVAQDAGFYWTWFVAPFLLGDAVKAVIAALLVAGGWKALSR
ncbi:biotin transporter BioY [Nioella ostreopsis]|jgi:biotin transport system substrate-specific component|uniref:biotin transporter BioY n=1 Tax=Nioella ostreopsis TaxID=2448479 RepID=UPI000FD7E58F|nr:biotin transporter BioY [Nioella ostreopsis]